MEYVTVVTGGDKAHGVAASGIFTGSHLNITATGISYGIQFGSGTFTLASSTIRSGDWGLFIAGGTASATDVDIESATIGVLVSGGTLTLSNATVQARQIGVRSASNNSGLTVLDSQITASGVDWATGATLAASGTSWMTLINTNITVSGENSTGVTTYSRVDGNKTLVMAMLESDDAYIKPTRAWTATRPWSLTAAP
jgi:hypothetical protein